MSLLVGYFFQFLHESLQFLLESFFGLVLHLLSGENGSS